MTLDWWTERCVMGDVDELRGIGSEPAAGVVMLSFSKSNVVLEKNDLSALYQHNLRKLDRKRDADTERVKRLKESNTHIRA